MSHLSPPSPTSTTPTAPAKASWLEVLAVPALLSLLGAVFVALALLGGDDAISTRENRTLAVWPTLSRQTIADGSWARDVDSFVADRFPFRDAFLDVAATMADLRGLDAREEVYDGDALGEVDTQRVRGALALAAVMNFPHLLA